MFNYLFILLVLDLIMIVNCDINLRSISDLSISKQKEKDVLEYIKYNNIEPTPDNIRKILGSNSNWIIKQLESK